MPDLVMHHYFGKKVFEKLDEEVREKIDNVNLYDFATAGPDPFFFVKFLKGKENKKSLEFGNYMHNNKTRDFFIELNKVSNSEPKMFSYLAGFICHYALDVKAHPYVFHKTGLFKKDDPSSLKYRGLHTKLERAMDSYIIKEGYKKNPNKFKISQEVLTLKKLDKSLKNGFDTVYKNVFNTDDGFNHVNSSVIYQRKFYKFVYDPHGIKQKLLTKLDNGTSGLDLKVLSYYNKSITDIDIFNLGHKEWINPIDNTVVSTESFFDLFNSALEMAISLIKASYNYIFKKEKIDLNNYFLNLSYLHGLDCEIKNEMKYFNNIFSK